MKVLICLLALAAGAMASGLEVVESSIDGMVLELTAAQPMYKAEAIRGDNYSVVGI